MAQWCESAARSSVRQKRMEDRSRLLSPARRGSRRWHGVPLSLHFPFAGRRHQTRRREQLRRYRVVLGQWPTATANCPERDDNSSDYHNEDNQRENDGQGALDEGVPDDLIELMSVLSCPARRFALTFRG